MSMDELVRIEGAALDALLGVMRIIAEHRDRTGYVRVCIDNGTFRIRIDEQGWSPPIGYRDPRSIWSEP